MAFKIHEVASISGLSIRALHHYDKINLLVPSSRGENNYRYYENKDLEKLQQILLLREMGFSLKKIKELLIMSSYDRQSALKAQLVFLEKQANRLNSLIELVNKTIESMGGKIKMDSKDLFKGFDYDSVKEDQKNYEDEVKERWGDTDAYKESADRTAKYSQGDWENIMSTQSEYLLELASLFKEGVSADDSRVQIIVNNNRFLIDKYFYSCSKEMFAQLGEMYVADERFKSFYDQIADGLAEYYREAIRFYCK